MGCAYSKRIHAAAHRRELKCTRQPLDEIAIGKRMYLHYKVVKGLQNTLWSSIAFSDDNGENWIESGVRWEGQEEGGLRQQWSWERGGDGWVYVVSSSARRSDPLLLYRVREDRLLDKAAYESWGLQDGKWAWGNPASSILGGRFGAMCLRRVENKWVLSWFNAADYDITIKVFDHPTDDLHHARQFKPIRGGRWGAENDSTVAQLYGGYIHPDSTLRELHLIVSQWNTARNWPYRAMQFVTSIE